MSVESQNGRRGFLKLSAISLGALSVAPSLSASNGNQADMSVYGGYEKTKIGTLSDLKKKGEIDFAYPDDSSLCKAVYVDDKPVAYSTICTHKGCPVTYDKKSGVFTCPCHFTKYDAKKDGQMIIGQATGRLPRVLLDVDGDDIYAYGVDGLIYGRINNTIG